MRTQFESLMGINDRQSKKGQALKTQKDQNIFIVRLKKSHICMLISKPSLRYQLGKHVFKKPEL